MVQRLGKIPLAQVGDARPGLELETFSLERLDGALELVLENVPGDFHDLGGFVAGDGLDVGAEGEDQGDNKESIRGQRSSDVGDDGQRFVTPVKQVQGTKHRSRLGKRIFM